MDDRSWTMIRVCSFWVIIWGLISGGPLYANRPTMQDITSRKLAQATPPVPDNLHGGDTYEIKSHSLGVGLGQTFLFGDFGENGVDQITTDLYYNYTASYSFDMMANFHYSYHEFQNRHAQLLGANIGIKSKLYHFDEFSPFLIAGLGFYYPQVRRMILGQLVESDRRLTFGVNFGAGAQLRLNSSFTIGTILHYHLPFEIKQENGPGIFGPYCKLLITVMYSFSS